MKSKSFLSIFAIILLYGCAPSGQNTARREDPISKLHEIFDRRRNITEQNLQDYSSSKECEGNYYDNILIGAEFFATVGSPNSASSEIRKMDSDNKQYSARVLNRLAEAAASKKCFDISRVTYLLVIDNYIGSNYASARQRAQIGIDDLRSIQQSSPGRSRSAR